MSFGEDVAERFDDVQRGDRISVTIGDFASVPVPGAYRLTFVV